MNANIEQEIKRSININITDKECEYIIEDLKIYFELCDLNPQLAKPDNRTLHLLKYLEKLQRLKNE